jgi:hypothetical protein
VRQLIGTNFSAFNKIVSVFIFPILIGSFNSSYAQWSNTGNNFTSGNVGIGGNASVSKLQISDGTGGEQIRISRGTGSIRFVQDLDRDDLYLINSNATRTYMFWGDNGFIGIGNYNPTGNLHIGKQEAQAGSIGEITRLVLQPYGHTGGPWTFKTRDNNQYAFLDISYGATPAITINSDGKVGIGTLSSGSFKLAVEGKIGAREVNVTTASWADYVFDDAYKLPSLQELEAYIKLNNHLPDVPTEAEVKANGVNLGEMNVLLLKKVEELTLLLIEQNKKLEAQNKKLEEQSERIIKLEKK